jgi:ubiquinone biosynthesis protein
MFRTLASLARLARAAWTLARHDAIFPAEYQAAFPASARTMGRLARLIAIRDRAKNPGERLANALEKLGPSYVKFGQVLATRADVIGADFARGLARLQDKMAPFPDALARRMLEAELGAPVEAHFSSFGGPVAAASIAQVHRATTLDGREVAVKILRPDIDRRIARDIDALRLGAKVAEGLFPTSRRLEPKAFVETVARSLTLELDLRLEAASASELTEAAVAAENFFIPEIDWARTTRRVLTTQWIDAIPLTDMAAIDAAGIDKVRLAGDLTDAFLTTALERGVFHADIEGRRSSGQRHFCRECGAFLWLFDPRWPELVHPFASAIDTPLPQAPEVVHIMLRHKASWVHVPQGPGHVHFDEYPVESLEAWHRRHGLYAG